MQIIAEPIFVITSAGIGLRTLIGSNTVDNKQNPDSGENRNHPIDFCCFILFAYDISDNHTQKKLRSPSNPFKHSDIQTRVIL